MAIDGGLRKKLVAGSKLVGKYRGTAHTAEVIAGEDGKPGFRLADGRVFKSPSAAASAVMGGISANGWRWWSVEGAEPVQRAATPATAPTTPAGTPQEPGAKPRPQCPRCGKSFVGASQLAHHEANADRLCNPAAVESTEA